MKNIKTLLSGIAISSLLFLSSCGNDEGESKTHNSPTFNILSSIKHPAVFTSVNVMELLKKSNIENSEDLPPQIKMMVNSQISQHLNSDAQGIKLEGNIPFCVTTQEDGSFESVVTLFKVLDAKKIGSSLCLYFGGKIQKEGNISLLKGTIPGTFNALFFAWDDTQLVSVFSENGAKEKALSLLKSKDSDASSNEKIQSFLDNHSDFSSLVFMDTYTNMTNKLSHTTMDEELTEAYKGVTAVASANFNAGDFTFTSDLEGENFISSKFNSIKNQPVDQSLLSFLTENNQAILFGTGAINLDAFINIAEQTHSEQGDYREELKKIGIDKDDITKVLTGDFAFSLLDVENVKIIQEDNFYYEDQPRYVLTCGIKDENLLKTVLTNNEKVTVVEDYYTIDNTFLGVANHKLFVSLSESLIQKLTNGEQLTKANVSIDSPIYGNIVADMNQLPENYKKLLLNEGGEEILKIYNEIDNITFTGDINHTEFSLKLNDQSKNAFEVFSNTLIKNLMPVLLGGMM